MVSNNAGRLVGNNGAGLVSNNGGGLVSDAGGGALPGSLQRFASARVGKTRYALAQAGGFAELAPPEAVVLRVRLFPSNKLPTSGGQVLALVAKDDPARAGSARDLDTASTLVDRDGSLLLSDEISNTVR